MRNKRIVALSLVVLLPFCLFATFLGNKIYRQPLNPLLAMVDEVELTAVADNQISADLSATLEPLSITAEDFVPTSDPTVILSPEASQETESVIGITGTAVPTQTPKPNTSPTTSPPPTETAIPAPERITILLMGSDSRVGALISRTDTMMLLSVNLQSQMVSLLSIPRDLYVEIPGYGRDRLNTALVHGANINDEDPIAGMEVAIQTVEQAIGVPIDHYVVVNLRALEESIDALGGVDMFVPYAISDPTYINRETGQPLFIPEGQNHFDGDTALRYVRTRNQDSDFARSNRQQQLLLALRQKALNLGMSEMLARAPLLYQNVKSGIFTDLSLEDMVALGQVAGGIPTENIHTAVLNSDYVTSYLSDEGSHVLLLKPETVAPLIQQLFFNQDSPENVPDTDETSGLEIED
jgi:LCP family protein required for cell wall assembly